MGWKNKLLFHGYDKEQKAFGSLLGISYYLKKVDFEIRLPQSHWL